jgi:ADP-ribose pyrophosphatase
MTPQDRPSPLAGISERAPEPKLGLQADDTLVLRGPRMDFVMRPIRTSSGQVQMREVVVHPGAVLILPLLADGRVVMIRNRRHTVGEELWELPAGTLEVGEDPALCAARELTEETGYTAGRIESLGWFYTSPGVLTEKMYCFVAHELTEGKQDLEDNEQIKVERVGREEILRLIQENKIVDAKSMAALLKYYQGH